MEAEAISVLCALLVAWQYFDMPLRYVRTPWLAKLVIRTKPASTHGYCVYTLWEGDNIAYIGMTRDLRRRLRQHKNAGKPTAKVRAIKTRTYERSERLEAHLIKLLQPSLNTLKR